MPLRRTGRGRVEIDGQTATVIGVMPEHSDFLSGDSELWLLQPPEQPAPRGAGPWFVLGQLKEGRSLDLAQTELQSVAARMARAYPNTSRDLSAQLAPLSEEITGPNQRLALWKPTNYESNMTV